MHAEICPICQGKGTICNHEIGTPQYLHPTCPTCHGCNGNGWVQVADDNSIVITTGIEEPTGYG